MKNGRKMDENELTPSEKQLVDWIDTATGIGYYIFSFDFENL